MTDDLIDLIYATLLGEASWQQFLDRLATGIPSGKASMVMHGIADPDGGYVPLSAGFDDAAIETYNAHYAALNLWQPTLARQRVGAGVIDNELFPREELIKSAFYNEFLLPNEIRVAAAVKIGSDRRYSFSLATLSVKTDLQIKQDMARRLGRLGPHLKRAFDYYRKGHANRALIERGTSVFDAIDIGVMVIGDGAGVKTISVAGQAMLADTSPVRISPLGRVRLRNRQCQAVLDGMLSRTYAGPKVVALFSHETKLTLIRVKKDSISLYFEGPTIIVLMERLGHGATAFDPRLASFVYGLTTAETRALSGIVAGKSVDRIAQEARRSRETIRVQMKSLYAKTGATSQADILRLLKFRSAV